MFSRFHAQTKAYPCPYLWHLNLFPDYRHKLSATYPIRKKPQSILPNASVQYRSQETPLSWVNKAGWLLQVFLPYPFLKLSRLKNLPRVQLSGNN